MKKLVTFYFLFVCVFANAQLVGSDAYIPGTFMELAITGAGGFEGVDVTVSPVPSGMHLRSANNLFGIVGNPQKNGWTSSAFDGDYFTPGSPENGWGFEIGDSGTVAAGTIGSNSCLSVNGIDGFITGWSHVGSYYSVDWEGDASTGADLHFKVNYSMQDTALFYTTTISVTNTGTSLIPKFYYYKSFDPDNNQEIGGVFFTDNKIERQPDSAYAIAHVSATQYVPWKSYIALMGIGSDWRASYGGFSNRDGSNLWNGTGFEQTVGNSDTLDVAIALAYRLLNILPGATESFSFQTVIDTAFVLPALYGDLFLDFEGENNNSSVLPDTIRICGTDSVLIQVSGIYANDYTWSWSPSAGLSDTVGLFSTAYPSSLITYTVIGTPVTGSTAPDTLLIVVETFPGSSFTANLSTLPDACSSIPAFALTGGTPAGGVYSGTSTISGNNFDPTVAIHGLNVIAYTVSDSTGCSSTDTATLFVSGPTGGLSALGSHCNYDPAFQLTGGSPAGGIYSGAGMLNDSIFDPTSLNGIYTIAYTYTDSVGCSDSDSASIFVGPCTGIGENETGGDVLIYPNPFTDQFNLSISNDIQLQLAELVISDVLGKIVFRTPVSGKGLMIHKNNLAEGIYFYRFYNQNTLLTTGKLLKN